MERSNIEKAVLGMLTEIDPVSEITTETDLLGEVLDSMSILYLMAEVFRVLQIEIPMTEVTIENFSTVNSIVNLVEKYSK